MTTKKRITKIMGMLQNLSNEASILDDGTQFKIVDRVLGNLELSEEDSCLEKLLDTITTECMHAREECK